MEVFKRCLDVVLRDMVDLTVFSLHLNAMIAKIFFKLNDSMITFTDKLPEASNLSGNFKI